MMKKTVFITVVAIMVLAVFFYGRKQEEDIRPLRPDNGADQPQEGQTIRYKKEENGIYIELGNRAQANHWLLSDPGYNIHITRSGDMYDVDVELFREDRTSQRILTKVFVEPGKQVLLGGAGHEKVFLKILPSEDL